MYWIVPYTLFDFVLIVLAALYAAEVLTRKDGPFGLFRKLREAGRQPLGGLLDCVWCTVFWAALWLFMLHAFVPAVTWVLAIGGAAMALRSYTGVAHG